MHYRIEVQIDVDADDQTGAVLELEQILPGSSGAIVKIEALPPPAPVIDLEAYREHRASA